MDVAHQLLMTVDLGQLPQLTRHLLNDPATRGTLLYNPSLPADAITHLLATATSGAHKLSAGELGRLASLELDDTAIDTFISKVRSVGPLTTLIERQELSSVQLEAIATAGKHVKGKLATALLSAGVDTRLMVEPVKRTGSKTLQVFMAADDDGLVSDDEVIDLIGTIDQWLPPTSGMGETLRPVLERSDAVLQAALDAPNPAVRAVAAGHRDLTASQAWQLSGLVRDNDRWVIDPAVSVSEHRFVWMGLLNNPVCPQPVLDAARDAFTRYMDGVTSGDSSMYEMRDSLHRRMAYKPAPVTRRYREVSDTDQLNWIVRRTCDRKRKVDLAEVLANPHLTRDHVVDLLGNVDDLPAVTARRIVEPLSAQLDRHDITDFHRWWQDGPEVGEQVEPHESHVRDRRIDREAELDKWQRHQHVIDDDKLGELSLSSLQCMFGAAGTATAHLGDDVAAWMTLMDLADGWDSSYGELLESAQLLAAA